MEPLPPVLVVPPPDPYERRRRSPPPPEILPPRYARMRSRSPPPPLAYERVRSPPIELRRGSSPPRYSSIRSGSPLRERLVVTESPHRSSYSTHASEKYVYEPPPTKSYESSRYSTLPPPHTREVVIESLSSHREYPPKPVEISRSAYSGSRLSESTHRRPTYTSQPEAYGGSDYLSSSRETSSTPKAVVVYDYKPQPTRSTSYYASEADRYRSEARNYEYR